MNIYNDILSLRNIKNNADRGYKFEQLIREIQPWDRKPAIVASTPSEQFDGIFLWKEQAYLIESKAKRSPITPGSSDWEDFELKIRKRKNSVIGLYCSLFPVSENIYKDAEQLNKEGHFIIVLAGDFWDELNKYQLPISDILSYMNLYGRIKFISKTPDLKIINDWCYNKDSVNNEIGDLCKKNSSLFLRRYRSAHHDELYIKRDIDKQIIAYCNDIRPSYLKKAKDKPKQICLVRDYSGSGKTTLSLELSSNSVESYFGTGATANESDIDNKIVNFFSSLGDYHGLLKLISVNKPIAYVIDSLDEANKDLYEKRKQVKGVIKFIDELNKVASSLGLLAFPVLFIFTIREDYWRDWESIFEGQRRSDINKRISSFSTSEFPIALNNYSKCYNYNITNTITPETKRTLSIPINLLIFSETYRYQGNITINEVWEGNVIDSYFVRRQNDIHKRYISGLTSKIFMKLISLISFHVIKTKSNIIPKNSIELIISNNFQLLEPYSDEIIHALISESILIEDAANNSFVMFRHTRFIEFLAAYYIVYSVESSNNLNSLDYYAQLSFESGIVLMFRVHDDIRYIAKSKFIKLFSDIEDYYSTSELFMSKKLSLLRSEIASNSETCSEDIDLILKNISSNNSIVSANSFFVIAAKSNKQPKDIIISLFRLAFSGSNQKRERYKLIIKLEQHDLLLHETTLSCLVNSTYPKDWEVYLGLIIKNNFNDFFKELWQQNGDYMALNSIMISTPNEDWSQVNRLFEAIIENKAFVLGDFDNRQSRLQL
ncbi:hypothetical protein [Hymenobacter bucti]|uniref:Restriction endonuclease type IV Mrr domain-containing protein n=1 Tax=Hymenobacter bucti TaxID=1844114 RepID=A0ABW4QX72_9BACT